MDIVLEVTDTFMWDHLYAWAMPARPAPYEYPNHTPANATAQPFSTWHYKPATAFFKLEPSQAAYSSAWPRDNLCRQGLSLFLVTWVFGLVLYFVFASLSYACVFDKKTLQHPKFLRNQVWLEIKQTMASMPVMTLCTIPLFLLEVRGHSKLYDQTVDGPGLWYNIVQFPLFLVFTDFWIYLIHRGLHHPWVYKKLHKPHHKWIMPTPYASHAFHPLDGFAQSLPYHVFPFIFPLQKWAYVALFVFINFWTILIHDGEFVSDNPVINGAACHSVHHLAFHYNYGQYFTLWDHVGGSYRAPDRALFKKEEKMSQHTWKKQVKEMETTVKEVEGDDDRAYGPAVRKSKKSR